MPKVFVRSLYNYDSDLASEEAGLKCSDVSRTIQSQEHDANINTIVRNFGVTGQLPQGVRVPEYSDFLDAVTDYRTAVEAVRLADASFLRFPADVRSRFDNDPQKFLEFCSDPANLPEMRKLGLAVPAPSEAPKEPTA